MVLNINNTAIVINAVNAVNVERNERSPAAKKFVITAL